jgi:hypothetical protein
MREQTDRTRAKQVFVHHKHHNHARIPQRDHVGLQPTTAKHKDIGPACRRSMTSGCISTRHQNNMHASFEL